MKLQRIIRYCLAGLVCGLSSKIDAAVPAAPENLQPAWLFGEIMLTWNEVPEAASYNIYRYDEANAVWVPTATNLNVPRYREMNVTEPTSYRVTAVNADGEGAPAGPVVAEQTGEGFVISLNQWLWSIYDTQAVIQWTLDLVAGADGMLEVGTSPTNLTSFAWDTNYTGLHRVTVTNLSPGTFYVCRITSVASNRTGVSGWTSFTTLLTNHPPVVQDQTYTMYEDEHRPLQLYAWDLDSQLATVSIVNGPSHGSITRPDEWNFTYVPDTNWFGTDTLTFVGSDGLATSAPATVTFNVMPINDPPQPLDQSVSTTEDTAITIPMLASDVEGDALTSVWITWGPTNGWAWTSGANVIYTPYANRSGDDAFMFQVCDANGACSWIPGTVVIHISPGNDAPQASDGYLSAHAAATTYSSFVVSDIDGDTLTAEVVSGPNHGQVTVNGTNFTYTPNPGVSFVSDSFGYRALDGQTNSSVASVWIWVGNTNTVPQAHDQVVLATQNKGTFFVLDVTEPDPDFLQLLVQAGPTNGTIEFSGIGVTYRPATNYLGPDSFTYRVFDGTETGNVATVTLEVIPNRPPLSDPYSFSVPEEWTADFTLTGSDPDGDPISFVLLSQPAHGTLREIHFSWPLSDYPGHYQYTPFANYHGPDSFTFTWNDGFTNGNIETVIITVTPVNDAPVANAQSVTTTEDTPKNITLTASDVENDPLNFIIVSNPAHGTLAGAAPNLVYTPATNYSGSDSFTFKAYDGSSNSAVKTVSITVTAVNDAPFAFDETVIVNEDTSTNITLNSFDPDGPNASYVLFSQPTHGTLTLMNAQGTIRKYTPAANYHGPDSFTFIVSDGNVLGNVGTIAINVTSVNDAPDAISQAYQIPEDTSLNVNLAGLVNDADGDPLTYTILTPPGAGTLSGTLPNLVYRPNTNFWGYDHFYFKVSDGMAETPSREIWIEINSVNDAPLALNTSFTVPEDGMLALSPSSTDVDYYPATYRIVTLPSHGTLTISGSASNNWTYRPATNFSGTDSIVFIANDLMADSNPGTVTIHVTSGNDAPAANEQTLTTAEETPLNITLTGSDVDNDALSYSIVSGPTNGTLTGTAPDVTYTPNTNFNGTDSFTFKVHDGTIDSGLATVTIVVTSLNDPPMANAATVTTDEDAAMAIALAGSDADDEALSYAIVSAPAHGTLSGTAPNVVYAPTANYYGEDSFTFSVTDPSNNSATATVTITVTPVDDAPVANAQSVTTVEDTPKNIALTASDVESDPLNFIVVTNPAHGALTGAAPNVVYTPAANYYGLDSFTFKVNDGTVDGDTVTVSLTVTAVNDAPIATAQSVTTLEDTAVNITFPGSDVDGDALNYSVVNSPAHGTLTGTGLSRVYTPAANYYGPDSFTFKVNDGTVDGNTATVSLTVTSGNDAPVANAQSVTTVEDTSKSITLTGSDVEGAGLSFVIVSNPTYGTLSGSGATRLYRPATNYSGPDSFTFAANDGLENGNPATVSISITPVNDAPIAHAQSVSTPYNTPVSITLTGSDPDGNALTYTVVNNPSKGTLSGTNANRTFTPNIGWSGTTSFTFRVNDGVVNSAVATVTITVAAATSIPAAPSGLTATAVSKSQINLVWTDNASNEDGFKIERSTNGTSWNQIATVGPNVLNYSSTGLSANKLYYYRVRAYNVLGNSAYSNTASATTLP